MASGAKADEVFFNIFSAVTPESLVMHLDVLHAPAELTSPAVATKNLKPYMLGDGARRV